MGSQVSLCGHDCRGLPYQSRPIQHPPHAGWTHRHHVGAQQHERQPPIYPGRL